MNLTRKGEKRREETTVYESYSCILLMISCKAGMQTKYVGGKTLNGTFVFTGEANSRQVIRTHVTSSSTKNHDKGKRKEAPNA